MLSPKKMVIAGAILLLIKKYFYHTIYTNAVATFYSVLLVCVADNDISTPIAIDLATIEVATIRFSTDNKLGEGRFGDVYKV